MDDNRMQYLKHEAENEMAKRAEYEQRQRARDAVTIAALETQVAELRGALNRVLRAYEADAETKDDLYKDICKSTRALLAKAGAK